MATIPTLKQSVLDTQTRLLSTPLSPSPTSLSPPGPSPLPAPLPAPLIHDIVRQVNALIRKHNLHVSPAPALRHVAEQIDALYWAAGAPDEGGVDDNTGAVGCGVDLRDDEHVCYDTRGKLRCCRRAILSLPDE
ncbi:hypothetical protein MMC26_000658 [Xylographa opegraphella]|nr:hypothetical protein [Xylographa opegraphella]